MQIGDRIIYNKETGFVLNGALDKRLDTGLTKDMINELRPLEIGFIDLDYDDTTLDNAESYHVDIVTRKIIVDRYIKEQPTQEQQKIQELENQLLLATDSQVGGIL